MPISFGNGAGSGLPYLRFKPSEIQWTAGSKDADQIVDPKDAPVIIDIERMQMGWMLLEIGNRDWQPWPNLSARTKKPEGEYKVGFLCHVFGKKLLGDEVHEFSSNGVASTMFAQNLYNAAEPKFGNGEVPVVHITGSKALKVGKGNTREILFEIVKWVPRPAELENVAAAVVEEPPFKAEPKAAAKTMANADMDEF